MHLVSDAMHIHRLLVGTISASRLLGDHSKAHARLDLELHDCMGLDDGVVITGGRDC